MSLELLTKLILYKIVKPIGIRDTLPILLLYTINTTTVPTIIYVPILLI
jgi:hypothetical protein